MEDKSRPGWTMVDNGLVAGRNWSISGPDRWLRMTNQREVFGNLRVSCNRVVRVNLTLDLPHGRLVRSI